MASLRLFILATPILLAACSSTPSPLMTEPVRPGADQSAPASAILPRAAPSGAYDASVGPDNEEKGSKVGATVSGSGGQKAQKDKVLKDESAADAEHARELKEQARQQSEEKTTSQ
jgi:hypothetical protein